MLGKKVFFIKEFIKQESIKDQIDFEEYLTLYTKQKLQAIINDEIHNDRNEEKNLSGVHFKVTYKDSHENVSDEDLDRIVQRIRYEIRDTDILVKWNKSELVLILLECTIESAQKIAFLLKSIVETKEYHGRQVELNYSITLHQTDDTVESFLNRLEVEVIA
jgi:GGDEF domain-containing protein